MHSGLEAVPLSALPITGEPEQNWLLKTSTTARDTPLKLELRVFLKYRKNCGEQADYTDRWMREHMTKKQTFLKKYCLFSVQFVPSVRSIVHAYQYGPVLYTFF
jgi:hypothetical protein